MVQYLNKFAGAVASGLAASLASRTTRYLDRTITSAAERTPGFLESAYRVVAVDPVSDTRVAPARSTAARMPRRRVTRRSRGRSMRRRSRRARRGVRRTRRTATVTAQRDTAVAYSGPSGGGDRAFRRRMRRALLAEQPLNVYTALFKSTDSSATGTQSFGTVYLADVNTTAQGDIWNLFKDAYSAAAVADVEQERLYIKSSAMDVQFKNVGTEMLYLDMYTCIARQSHDSTATLNSDIGGWFGDMVNIGAVGSTTPGYTLFQVPGFCRKWKIIKTQRVLVKPDEIVATTVWGPKNRMISGRQLQDYRASLKGITRAVIFQVRGVPEFTVSDSGLTGFSYCWSAQSRFTYAKPPGNTSETIGQSK